MLVKENPVEVKPEKPLSYPVLVRAKGNKHVVLMTSKHDGVVLVQGNYYKPVGHHSNSWVDADDSDVWEILPDGYSLTLTQNQQG